MSRHTQLPLFPQYIENKPQYISVSRRTDIPRFYHHSFLEAWQQGKITYKDNYGTTHAVSLLPRDVLGYIFWSKDYEPILKDPRFKILLSENNAIFHFTINHCSELEPGLAPLPERLETLHELVDLVGPKRIIWRFDPICRYQGTGPITDNCSSFYSLLPIMTALGIKHCFFSFMTHYAKLKKRSPIVFHHFNMVEKQTISSAMVAAAKDVSIGLYACCDPELVDLVPTLRSGSCINNQILASTDRFNRHLPLSRKPTRKGCKCYSARDVGSYNQQCGHGCLYCYANPQLKSPKSQLNRIT
ncbi:MAG: DUF1848 domain-containing protein [Desulfobulbaceae bacterium]|nr:DUF1848 domain-containing protein [Desulfobulbaceae bacterium]